MNWQPIENSNALRAVAYDPASYILGVQTSNGTPYFYLGVPPEVHAQFLTSESKGKFGLSQIKPKYQCQKSDGTVAARSPEDKPVAEKIQQVIDHAKAKTPAVATQTLALSFEAGTDSVGFPALPFEQMVERLKEQLDGFCSQMAA